MDKLRGTSPFDDELYMDAHEPNDSLMQANGGSISIQQYTVFPGIWLEAIDVYATSFCLPYTYPDHCIRITHCRKGRLEYESPIRFTYLNQGDLVLHTCSSHTLRLDCPMGHYHGLSMILDLEAAPKCTSCLLADVEIELSALFQRLLPEGSPFVLRATQQLEHVFSEFYEVPPSLQKGYYKVKTLELLLFLSRLDLAMSETKQHVCALSQAALAKQVFAFIQGHRSLRITAQELAKELHVSPGQLRRSMGKMYGRPLYQCIRSYKMYLAAQELLASTRTVADIAGEFGYDNSSKFAGAFQSVMGYSPGEYRANGRLGQNASDILERTPAIPE